MSSLILEELIEPTPLVQSITSDIDQTITIVRPHLYLQNSPPGAIKMEVYDSGDTTLLAESSELTIASLKSQAGITQDYFHGYIRFDLNVGLSEGETVLFKLVPATGYTFSSTDFVGWCLDYDLRKYTANYTPNAGQDASFDVELWGLNEGIRGI